jgi:adenosine deaminase CECR1
MSHDYYQAMMSSNTMSLLGWKVLAQWSFEHNCMDNETRAETERSYNKEWRDFCQWIVDNYNHFDI